MNGESTKLLITYTLAKDIKTEKPDFDYLLNDNYYQVGLSLLRYWDTCKTQIEEMRDVNIGTIKTYSSNGQEMMKDVLLYNFSTANGDKLKNYVKVLNLTSNPEQYPVAFPIFTHFREFTEVFRYKIQQGRLIKIIQDNITMGLYVKGVENKQGRIFPQEFIYRFSKYLDILDMKFLVKSSMI